METQTTLKMFISYSHADKDYLHNFKNHLISLKRNGVIDEWDDKEMLAGERLDEEIQRRLMEADVVIFLVSVDFLNSFYGYEIELSKTLDRMNKQSQRVIPIILRACDWKSSKFGVLVALPEDGKPISSYPDQDGVWLEVIEGIKKVSIELQSKRATDTELTTLSDAADFNSLSDTFGAELRSTEIVFQHSYKDSILLEDIFVYPDLKILKEEYDDIDRTVSSEMLTAYDKVDSKVLLLGEEQVGKTALLKMLFAKYHCSGVQCVLLNGLSITKTDLKRVLSPALKEQYSSMEYDHFIASPKRKVLFVDDFHLTKLNERYQHKFLELAIKVFGKVIIIADQSFKYVESEYISFADFTQYEILPFGHLRRSELINKWNTIGREETLDIKEIHMLNDGSRINVDAVIRKNIVPRKPVYILAILQSLEIAKPGEYGLTSYGHCYQYLIQQSLYKARIKSKDLDAYINFLTELAYFIYGKGAMGIDEAELEEFKIEYSKMFLLRSYDTTIGLLLSSGVLKNHNNKLEFGYRYIFYFYVAKYLADHLDRSNCRTTIQDLCGKIHTEKNANILIFLVHHSKDQTIIDEILLCTLLIFDNIDEASLDMEDTAFLAEFIKSIPELVIEQRNVEEERLKQLKEKDRQDISASGTKETEEEDGVNEGTLAEINRSARAVDIIGQILRNRHGSLTRQQLHDLAASARSVGLRFMKFYLNLSKSIKEDILKLISDTIRSNSDLSDDDIVEEARKIYLTICYGVSYAVIQRIANSLGSEQLISIFEELRAKYPATPAIQLIDIAIKLEFTSNIPKKEIKELFGELKSNIITRRMLQEVVLQHLYLHYTDFRDKQWISDTLSIPMQPQMLIEGKKTRKKMAK